MPKVQVTTPHGTRDGTLETGVVKQAAVAGGAAGDITVNGVSVGDELVSVIQVTATTAALTDLTSEFTITAANTINNTGGTATTGNGLIVTWIDRT